VVACGRDGDALAAAVGQLRTVGGVTADRVVVGVPADVGDAATVRALVQRAVAVLPSLDVLVSNAGVLGPVGPLSDVPWDDWAAAIAVNLLGPALLMRAALPHLRAHGRGRIIQLSGGGATKAQPFRSAYGASKAGVVRLVETIAGEEAVHGVTVNAIAPGAINTRFLDELVAAGPERAGEAAWAEAQRQLADGGSTPERAARLAVLLASAQGAGITGRLLSAIWDDWEGLPERATEVAGSELYTLRRLTEEHLPLAVERPV
jgi:NAD(P)-dependent dehydrogenase (short-subunit alcohol dehydrogenase family)